MITREESQEWNGFLDGVPDKSTLTSETATILACNEREKRHVRKTVPIPAFIYLSILSLLKALTKPRSKGLQCNFQIQVVTWAFSADVQGLCSPITGMLSHVTALSNPQMQFFCDSITGATLRLGLTDVALIARVYKAGGSSMDGAGFYDHDTRKHNH